MWDHFPHISSHLHSLHTCALVAQRRFARLPRVSARGRKSSRHPPPPNCTSTCMCQDGENVRFSVEAIYRGLSLLVSFLQARPLVPREPSSPPGPSSPPYGLELSDPFDSPHLTMFAEPLPPPDPPNLIFTHLSLAACIFRARPSTGSSFFPTVCRISHRVLFAQACLTSATSPIRHCPTLNLIADIPRACHSALTQPHRMSCTPLRVPFRQGTLLPRHPRRCSLLQCPPQPRTLPFRPEEHHLGPLGPLGRTHPSDVVFVL